MELQALMEALDASGTEIDPDLESGVLSIYFEDDSKYVVNSHRAARQIWMAAERQAWHFDYIASDGRWVASNGDELWSILSSTLSHKLAAVVELSAKSPS
jgi:CyaY protein